ncbi:hypothetical protein [Sandaracinus amylolyticus]|uniref:hypothetical protein n=1 Tax=Sandaracinus amylolyticus TaxID=927083 RepID=UPI00069ED4FE|nr:hypothetical protein [Sandaracinus amylolyticus]
MRTKLGLAIALVASLVASVARADAVPACGPFEHREGRPHESECRFGPAWLCSVPGAVTSHDEAIAPSLVVLAGLVVMVRRRSRR